MRGAGKARSLILRLIQQSLSPPDLPVNAAVMHADAPEAAEQMRNLLESGLNCQNIILSQMGPGTAAGCGLGTVGAACVPVET